MLAIALAGLLATGSGSPPEAAFRRAVELVESFQDEAARKAFAAILAASPPKALAARCHVYLGRIAIEGLDADSAIAEFLEALRLDPFIEPGIDLSPKGRTLFEQARQRYTQAAVAAPAIPARAAPAAPPPTADLAPLPEAPAAAVSSPEPASSSRVPAYVAGSVGVASLAAAGILGWLSQQSLSSARADASGSLALGDLSSAHGDALAADVLYGVGAAALVTAVVLFFVEGEGPASTPAAGTATP